MLPSVCGLQSWRPVLVPLAYSEEFRLIPGPGALMPWKRRIQQHRHMVQLQVWLLPEAFASCKHPESPCYLHSPFVSTLYFVLFSSVHVLQAFKFFDDCNWVTCLAISPKYSTHQHSINRFSLNIHFTWQMLHSTCCYSVFYLVAQFWCGSNHTKVRNVRDVPQEHTAS